MRDLMMLGAMFFLIPMALRNTFVAYLIWGWTSFIAIDEYLYGFMVNVRMNLLFAVITLGMVFMNYSKLKGRWNLNRTSILLIIWFIHGTLSAIFAYPNVVTNWILYEKLAKIMIFVLIMPIIVYGRFRIHSFVIALSLGIGFHSLLEGLKYIASGGGHRIAGLAKWGDNNLFAVMVLMGMPLLLYIYRQSENRLTKYAALLGAGLTVATVMGTNSRGGMLAMVAAGLWLIFTGRRKILALTVVGVMTATVITFAPDSWLDRMDTIQAADQDQSFLGRVEAWQISSSMALKNPVLGGGFHAIENPNVWAQFRGSTGLLGFLPDYDFKTVNFRAAHSAYFEVMGDRGLLGFLIFIAILINTIATTFDTRQLARAAGPDMAWAADLATALSAVIIAYAIGAAGVSVAYSEMLYVVAIFSEILKHHVLTEIKNNPGSIKY